MKKKKFLIPWRFCSWAHCVPLPTCGQCPLFYRFLFESFPNDDDDSMAMMMKAMATLSMGMMSQGSGLVLALFPPQ